VFDYGVNSGVGRPIKSLQKALGVVADGQFGPLTKKALAAADPSAVVKTICTERLQFLRGLLTWPVFGKGWSARVAGVRTFALALTCQPSVAQGKAV
jgi:lysozyme family protein